MSVPSQVLNDMFSSKLNTSEGKEKIAEVGSVYIRDRLREVCFVRQDPAAGAGDPHRLPALGQPRHAREDRRHRAPVAGDVDHLPWPAHGALIRAPRCEVPFFTISSEKFEKTEQELLAYEMPVTKIIEDNSVKDLQEVKDRTWLLFVEAGIQAMQTDGNGGVQAMNVTSFVAGTTKAIRVVKGQGAIAAGLNDFVIHPILRPDLVNLFKLIDANRLRAERFLMTEPDYDDILSWTLQDMGDKMQSETMVDGYKYNLLLGRKLIRTVKTDILRVGNVYAFTAPEFLGKNYVLNNTKFYIDKIANMITWQSWMDVAVAVINIASMAKLELYGGSVTPTATDTGFAALLPVDEDSLGAVNNKVDSGLKFPNVSQF